MSCGSLSSASEHASTAMAVRIRQNPPAPERWTMVKELNIEKRDPCEIWRSGINHQLCSMKKQMLCYESTIRRLEESIARERQATPVARSRSDEGGSGDEDACATSTKSVMVQTDDWEEQHQEGVSN